MGLAASRQEAFWEACGFGDKIQVKKMIQEGIDVDWVSYTHNSCPIHVASQGKQEIVQMLLDAKCNVNAKDDRGNLALHHAAMNGHAPIIDVLIKAGSDVNAQDKNGWTPLINAAYFCKLEAVKCLILNGASVLIQNNDQRSALHEACRSSPYLNEDHLHEISQLLIKAGSDINSKSSDKGEADFTPLMFCAYHGHPKVAEALIHAGCDINAQGSNKWSALHWASDRNNILVAKVLIFSGIEVLLKGVRGELALDRAQTKEMYRLIYKAVEDASYNFEDPNRPTEQRLKEITTKIFETADKHKNLVEKNLLNSENDSNSTFSTSTSPTADFDNENGDEKELVSFDPESKVLKREHRYNSNSAQRLSLILSNSVSPLNNPPKIEELSKKGIKMSNGVIKNRPPLRFICDEESPKTQKKIFNNLSLTNGYIK